MEEKKRRGRPKKETVEAEPVAGAGKNGNLVPLTQRSPEEARAIRQAGAFAANEKRRQKKELREFTKDFLMQDAAKVLKQNMAVLGVEEDDMTNLAAMVIRLFSKAVNNGDLNAARTIIEWAGMAPLQQEQENAAIAKMSQVMQLAAGDVRDEDDYEDVVFYIPDNGRTIANDDLVTVKGGAHDADT